MENFDWQTWAESYISSPKARAKLIQEQISKNKKLFGSKEISNKPNFLGFSDKDNSLDESDKSNSSDMKSCDSD